MIHNWCPAGAWGNEPLIVSGDKAVIHFRSLPRGVVVAGSDGTAAAAPEATTAHWGFRVVAETPVREDVVQEILEAVVGMTAGAGGDGDGEEEGQAGWPAAHRRPPSASFVRHVVAMFHNDIGTAGSFVQEAMLMGDVEVCV